MLAHAFPFYRSLRTSPEKAVSDHSGQAKFQVAQSSSMGHLVQESVSPNGITVETISLDQFITTEGLPLPDIIKVDIEGAEFDFLRGSQNLLENNQVTLFLATHGEKVHNQCLDFLREIRYELTSLDDESLETTSEILASKST